MKPTIILVSKNEEHAETLSREFHVRAIDPNKDPDMITRFILTQALWEEYAAIVILDDTILDGVLFGITRSLFSRCPKNPIVTFLNGRFVEVSLEDC